MTTIATPPATATTLPGTTALASACNGSVFARTLYENRRIFTVWTVATALLAMVYASFYPRIPTDSMASVPEAMRGFGFDSTTTAAGYLQGAVFGLLVPLLVTFYGAATGARMISTDEESGYLDLLLAHPVSRPRLLLHRYAALATGVVTITTGVLGAVLAVRTTSQLDSITVGNLAAQVLNLALLGLLFGALATAIGAATGNTRATVFGVTAGLGVAAYAMHGFAPQIGVDWLRYLTPYHYYIDDEPLKHGLQPMNAAVLAATTMILIAVGTLRFARRDLGR